MTLEEWLNNKWLKKEKSAPGEIASLFYLVDRYLHDASVDIISSDARLQFAFNAILTSATIALRALSYRIPPTEGHHEKTINSLKFTIGADSALISNLNGLRKKRINITYDTAGSTSNKEVEEAIGIANDLSNRVKTWLAQSHPDLLL